MKKLSFVVSALAVMAFSSCYVEGEGPARRHRMFYHPRAARVEIRGSNDVKHNNTAEIHEKNEAERH